MDRRRFLKQSIICTLGALSGLGAFARSVGAHTAGRPRFAIIIDDIGFSRKRARAFLALDIPITFSVLPRVTYSRDLACEIFDHGREIMLHQPMEPCSPAFDPGPGALYTGYRPERICEIMEENIVDVPFATGVNNHMGSRFTTCSDDIAHALSFIRARNLFFVDSVTSHRSVAFKTAKLLHMTAARRNIFLDTNPREDAILGQLRRLADHARVRGEAIGIGHPFPATARAIRRFIATRGHFGLLPVHVSQILYS